MGEFTGRCLCGNLSWSTPGPILWAVHCHCESCRRASSSAFVSFFGVPRSSVKFRGDVQVYESSKGVLRGRCPDCGTQTLCKIDRWPDEMHLFAATLDDKSLFKPTAHVHWQERVSWMTVEDDLPKYPGSADNTTPIENQAVKS